MTNHIQYQKDGDLVTLTMNWPGSVNLMDEDFPGSIRQTVEQLEADKDGLKGVLLRSAKSTFFAGGDLKMFGKMPQNAEGAKAAFDMVEDIKSSLRRLETLGKPVVAIIEGAALGGGWEIALACHQRVVVDSPKVQLGTPEVTLGLLPGGGGIVRMVRYLGLTTALPFLLEGKPMKPAKAAELGLAQVVKDSEEATKAALAWIDANPAPVKPWDAKGYKIPGGKPYSPAIMPFQTFMPSYIVNKSKGLLPAPEAILSAAVEGATVGFDAASKIESRYFAKLVVSQVSRNMIGTLFLGLNEIKGGSNRPQGVDKFKVQKLGILGAGMMGAGIAYVAAGKGIEVVLLDTTQDKADKGKAYTTKVMDKAISRGRGTEERKEETLGRIKATTDYEDLKGCDLIIEAVFEDPDIKAEVIKKAEPMLREGGFFGSNTSSLPITSLAKNTTNEGRFVGLHFFSPVDRMPLVEIVRGKATSDETIAHAVDFTFQMGMTPIVVNDARSFFTSRVFAQFILEGAAMLGEGIPMTVVENAAQQAGMPAGPLTVLDEVTLTLPLKGEEAAIKAGDKPAERHPGYAVLEKMVQAGRTGRSAGKGFYEYSESGKKPWAGLAELFPVPPVPSITSTPVPSRHAAIAPATSPSRIMRVRAPVARISSTSSWCRGRSSTHTVSWLVFTPLALATRCRFCLTGSRRSTMSAASGPTTSFSM